MDFITDPETLAAIGAILVAARAIARATPNDTDNKVLKVIRKVARVIGADVPDNAGKKGKPNA